MISIIITTYDRPNHLRASLLALTRQSAKFDEIIIADDGSDKHTRKVIENFSAMFKFPLSHVRQEHKGFRAARSRNNAIRISKGGFLAFLDQDGVAHADWLARHFAIARPAHFTAGGLLMLDEEETSSLTEKEILSGEFEGSGPFIEKKRLRKLQRKSFFYAVLRKCGLGVRNKPRLDSGNFAAFRTDLEKVNGFDENFVGWGQEDDDLARRFFLAGVQAVPVVSRAGLTHLWHPRDKSAPAKWDEGKNIQYYQKKIIEAYCKNGLKNPDDPHDDVTISRYNYS